MNFQPIRNGPNDAPSVRPTVCLVGGPDVDARRLLMQRLRVSFDVCAVGTEPRLAARFAGDGLRYRSYRMPRGVHPLRDLYAVYQLVRIFRSERATIVHTFDTKPAIWGRLAGRIAGVPVVVGTLPGLGSLYASPNWKGRLTRVVYQPLQALACRLADMTVFQNEDDAREFERRRVLTSGRFSVIPGSGVSTDLFAPVDPGVARARRAELGLDGGVVVVMVSRVLRSKGVLDYCGVARAVREVEPSARFLLVGDEDRDSLDSLTAGELDEVRGSVTWLGYRDDVREILSLADIFVFPSFYREGVPRVLLEAGAMALPLVVADVPGSRDVVEHGENGFVVSARDVAALTEAVLRLAENVDLRRRFGEASRRRIVSCFDLTVATGRIDAIYRDLLAAKGLA